MTTLGRKQTRVARVLALAGLAKVAGLALTGLTLTGLTLNAGCVRSKGLSGDEKERLKAYVVDQAPADAKKIDVNFENKVHLIGYKVEPETAKPGQEVKITFYWRCDDKVGDGWLLFTHVFDEAQGRAENLDWSGPIRELKNDRQALGPERWEPGKVYVDEQTYRVPDSAQSPELVVFTGIWKGESRLRVVSGPTDGDNRAIAAKIKTGLPATGAGRQPTDIPQLRALKLAAGEKIVVDGKADDKAWRTAGSTGPFVDVGSGRPAGDDYPTHGEAKVAWDDENLYLLIDVKDKAVTGGFDAAKKGEGFTATGQPKLWTRDTAEIMVDPDGDGDNVDYYEIQIGPQNIVFKSQFDGYNAPKAEPNGPYGHEDWDPKMKTAVVVRGTMDKDSDIDDGYTVEAAIPWAGFSKAKNRPPKNGDSWRINFYAMQNNGGVAWSPILGQGNFHKASRFGRVTWVVPGAEGATATAGATASGEPAAGAAGGAAASAQAAAAPQPSASAAPSGRLDTRRLNAVVPKGATSATR